MLYQSLGGLSSMVTPRRFRRPAPHRQAGGVRNRRI